MFKRPTLFQKVAVGAGVLVASTMSLAEATISVAGFTQMGLEIAAVGAAAFGVHLAIVTWRKARAVAR